MKKVITVFAIIIFVPVILCAGIYLYIAWQYHDTYMNGVMINGIYAAGMTPEEAVKLAAKTVGGQRFRRLRAAGKRNRLPDTCYERPVQCPERRRQKDFQRHKNSGLD